MRFNKSSKTYAENIDVQAIVASLTAKQIQQHISPNELTLDIGCGTGQLKQLLPTHNIIGVDVAENMCRETHHLAICADATALPFADNSIDAAISSLCFQWLPLPQAIGELHRVLRPNATAIIATLSYGTMLELQASYEKINLKPRMLNYLTSAKIVKIFAQNGFSIITHHHQKTILHHPSAWQLFKQLKNIGANRTTQLPPLTFLQLKQLMQAYEMQQNGVPVSYYWDCLTLQKKP